MIDTCRKSAGHGFDELTWHKNSIIEIPNSNKEKVTVKDVKEFAGCAHMDIVEDTDEKTVISWFDKSEE